MFVYPTIVTASDAGPDGLATPVSLITMMQNCSLMWLSSEPEYNAWLNESKLALVLTSRQVDIVRRPAFGEKVEVQTGVWSFRGYLGYRNTWIVDESGDPVAKCWCMGAVIDLPTGKIARIPNDVSATITLNEKRPMEYLPYKIALPDGRPEVLDGIVVRPSDIDLNRHVNNAQYVRMVCDLIPEVADACTRMRMEYKGQAKLGDTLVPAHYTVENTHIVTLTNTAGLLCAVVELS